MSNHDLPERCVCCGATQDKAEIDFHHWRYNDEEPGCFLCRNCHSHIHRGVRASAQTRRAGWHWKRDAVRRLLDLAADHNHGFDSVDQFCKHFGIPDNVSREEVERAFNPDEFSNSLTARMRHRARYGSGGGR